MFESRAWTPILYGLAVVAVLALGLRWMGRAQAATPSTGASPHAYPSASPGPASLAVTAATGPVVVDVAGAVKRPGVYRLRAGARVVDALHRAGGTTARADRTALNLAARLEDGRQVLVPERASGGPAAGTAAGAGAATLMPGAAVTPAVPLDLNRATAEQLDTLDGIGPAMIQRILEYRTAHNGFRTVDELGQVPGIGDKRLAALREKVHV